MVEDEIIGSQTEDESQDDNDSTDEVLAMFDIAPKKEEGEKVDPPIEQPKPEEKKGITVKYNKEDTFIEEDKIPEYARKGLNYDKVEGRAKELQDSLERAAKIAGYADHAAYTADLDRLEKEHEQKQKDQFEETRQSLREEAVENGFDPDKVDAWLDNHPLLQEASKAIQDRQKAEEERQKETTDQAWQTKWDELYKAFPETAEQSKSWERGETPVFMTAEMQSRIERGYDPVDAYKRAHADKIQTQTKAKTEQRLIKEQQLGLRSQVVTNGAAENETSVPDDLANAFEMFGLPAESAKKYMKK